MPRPKALRHSPYVPFDDAVTEYNTAFGHLTPWQYAGWKKETLSWKHSGYIHGNLNPASPYLLEGPGALQLLKDACINDFTRFSVGASKHAVMCNELGNVMSDGIVMRTGELRFIAFFLSPYIDYLVASGRYDVQGKDLTGELFLFQVAGPKSLEILEAFTQQSLRDIKFLWHRPVQVSLGKGSQHIELRIFRLGVARTLAYEVHGPAELAPLVYEAIEQAGKAFGIERLGLQAYGMNHTEGGFAQSFIHFLPAWSEDPAFMAYVGNRFDNAFADLEGSLGPAAGQRHANPYELGWGQMITFDHPFVGDRALRAVTGTAHRRIVTLEWNIDDVLGVLAEQAQPESEVHYMDWPANPIWQPGAMSTVIADAVQADGRKIGISSGRMFSAFYGRMISLGIIAPEYCDLGTEVSVLWGNPATPQRLIRATVSRYPYLDLPKNRDIDVSKLP